MAITLVALLLLMQTPAQHYDSGLYYLQAMRWITGRRVEIGVVNLHFRLALNDTWFVLSALLEHPLAIDTSTYFVNLLPMLFAAAGASGALGRLLGGDRSFSNLALALVLVPLGFATIGLGAQQADRVLTFLIPFTLALWARALEAGQPFAAEARAAALLSLFAALLKVSAFPLAAGGVLVLALHRGAMDRRFRVGLLGLAALAVVPWLLRSVLHSGCLVYPAAATCFNGLRWSPDASGGERGRRRRGRLGAAAGRRADQGPRQLGLGLLLDSEPARLPRHAGPGGPGGGRARGRSWLASAGQSPRSSSPGPSPSSERRPGSSRRPTRASAPGSSSPWACSRLAHAASRGGWLAAPAARRVAAIAVRRRRRLLRPRQPAPDLHLAGRPGASAGGRACAAGPAPGGAGDAIGIPGQRPGARRALLGRSDTLHPALRP